MPFLATLRSGLFLLTSLTLTMSAAPTLTHDFFVGTYTRTTSRGIYAVKLDAKTGALSTPTLVAETPNPTFLALHPTGKFLYALDESPATAPGGSVGGAIRAFALDPATAQVTPLNREPTGGGSVTHLAVDATGRSLVTVSYGAGQLTSFPLLADGRLSPRQSFIQHTGPLGPNRTRQEKPHAHSVTLSPDNRFAWVADLAMDRVFSYRLDATTSTLSPNDPPSMAVPPGAGPRHSKFSADGRFFYVLNEIDGTVTVCAYDASNGRGQPVQNISTLPADFKITNDDRAAEIRIHPNGRFLYASNRGHDSIAVFAINPRDGQLTTIEFAPCGGKAPRNFALSPNGAWLVCAHQDSDSLCSFAVDSATGRLTRVPGRISIPMPVCVLFVN